MAKKQKQSRIQSAKQWLLGLPPKIKWATAGVVIFLLVVIGLVILVQVTKPRSDDISNSSAKNSTEARVQEDRRNGALFSKAKDALQKGDSSKAAEVYQSEIDSEKDSTKKVKLYINQSGVLYGAGKYSDAIAVAREAEPISNDKFLVADWLSRIYEEQKQYALAAQYYTLAGKWASSVTNETGYKKAYYDQQAARVSVLGQHR